jgi:hypothetical protein
VPPIVTWNEWAQIVTDVGIGEKEIDYATNHFCSMGDILQFKGLTGPGGEELIMLDPQWISDVSATMLNGKIYSLGSCVSVGAKEEQFYWLLITKASFEYMESTRFS